MPTKQLAHNMIQLTLLLLLPCYPTYAKTSHHIQGRETGSNPAFLCDCFQLLILVAHLKLDTLLHFLLSSLPLWILGKHQGK